MDQVCQLTAGTEGQEFDMDRETKTKRAQLYALLRDMDSVVVAYSGGVDSTYLLAASIELAANPIFKKSLRFMLVIVSLYLIISLSAKLEYSTQVSTIP